MMHRACCLLHPSHFLGILWILAHRKNGNGNHSYHALSRAYIFQFVGCCRYWKAWRSKQTALAKKVLMVQFPRHLTKAWKVPTNEWQVNVVHSSLWWPLLTNWKKLGSAFFPYCRSCTSVNIYRQSENGRKYTNYFFTTLPIQAFQFPTCTAQWSKFTSFCLKC